MLLDQYKERWEEILEAINSIIAPLHLRSIPVEQLKVINIDFSTKRHLIPAVTEDGRIVIIKLYGTESSYSGDNVVAEVKGYIRCQSVGIRTPELIASNTDASKGIQFVIVECLNVSKINPFSEDQIEKVIVIIKRIHTEAKLIHGDTDLINFGVTNYGDIVVFDFASCQENSSGDINMQEIYYFKAMVTQRLLEAD